MMISGFASKTAFARASASNTSTTTGCAPKSRRNSSLSGERVVPHTEWPAARRSGVSRRPMTPAAPARNIRLTRFRQLRLTEPSCPQIFVEPIDRPPPGFFGRRLIVARRRVVVEAVVGAFVDVTLVRDARLGEGGVEGRPAAGDTLIEFAILRVDRRLDFRRVGRVRLEAIEWDGGVEIGA